MVSIPDLYLAPLDLYPREKTGAPASAMQAPCKRHANAMQQFVIAVSHYARLRGHTHGDSSGGSSGRAQLPSSTLSPPTVICWPPARRQISVMVVAQYHAPVRFSRSELSDVT